MDVTPETVRREYEWVDERADVTVRLINGLREEFSDHFETDVDPVTVDRYREEVDTVFSNGPRAVNVAALVGLLRRLDVTDDYPGFVVDEYLGRELAGTIAGGQPFGLLGEAAFHYADIGHHPDDGSAGLDDLDAALAAGFQTRLPGWEWTDRESPFGIDVD